MRSEIEQEEEGSEHKDKYVRFRGSGPGRKMGSDGGALAGLALQGESFLADS